jgi:signal transduction histidine kinase
MDKPQVAKKLLLESLDFSEGNKMGETTKEIYNGLYTIYSSQKNYKEALRYFELYVTYKDSINSIEVTTKINQYKEQFEAEQRDRKIDQLEQQALLDHLNQEKLKEVNRRRNTRSIFIGIAITLLLIIVIVVQRYFHLKQKAKSELLLINEEINQQKMVDLIKNQEVNSINSYMEGQERERNRIAAELHDRLGSLLSTVKLHFSTLERMWKKNYGESEGFTFALDLLDNSVAEVRSISHNLSKGVLMQFSLTEAVENLKDAINIAGRIQVKVIKVGPKHLLKPEIEIELFRVIQELITNAVKHSQAKEIFVQLIADNDGLNITVEDHGIGFDIKTVNSNGLGLKNLKSRVEAVGGDVHFESAVGKGTSVMIEIKNQA